MQLLVLHDTIDFIHSRYTAMIDFASLAGVIEADVSQERRK